MGVRGRSDARPRLRRGATAERGRHRSSRGRRLPRDRDPGRCRDGAHARRDTPPLAAGARRQGPSSRTDGSHRCARRRVGLGCGGAPAAGRSGVLPSRALARTTAHAWLSRSAPTVAPGVRRGEELFRRFGWPLVAVAPNGAICFAAGSTGMGPHAFALLNLSGTMIRLALIWWLGDVFELPCRQCWTSYGSTACR